MVHICLKQLEMIRYVRQVDEASDPLWAITIIGKGGMGKPTLDMKDAVHPPETVQLEDLVFMIKGVEKFHQATSKVMDMHAAFLANQGIPSGNEISSKLASRRFTQEAKHAVLEASPNRLPKDKRLRDRAKQASETARPMKPGKQ